MKNWFIADTEDMAFVLWEQLRLGDLLAHQAFADVDAETVKAVLAQAVRFTQTVLGPVNQDGDRQGCRLQADGQVAVPASYRQVWTRYVQEQWGRLTVPRSDGGHGLPYIVGQAVNELFYGANPAFMTYAGFSVPLYFLIKRFGGPVLQARFCEALVSNTASACLCMTEAQAGSDVGAIASKATLMHDGVYALKGVKQFISAGDHTLSANIYYVVLARTEGAPAGTLGLSCFIVPKYRLGEDGSLQDNHVRCRRLEHKMGLHGCATAELSFGESGHTQAFLLGEAPNRGLPQLLTMMNQARIATGIYALGIASCAYLNAVRYAHERQQGSTFVQAFNPRAQKVSIITHPDVKRMVLEMKSVVEGCRILAYKMAYLETLRSIGVQGDDHGDFAQLSELLTPIVKAYISDEAWRVAELAIQVHGGAGYTSDFPVEQAARDVKIMSIWEGTNYIQAIGLLREKLAMGRSSPALEAFLARVRAFLNDLKDEALDVEAKQLASALDCLTQTHARFGSLMAAKNVDAVLAGASTFLSMLAKAAVGWLLLEAASVARAALSGRPAQARADFYEAKILSARFYFASRVQDIEFDARRIEREGLLVSTAAQNAGAMALQSAA